MFKSPQMHMRQWREYEQTYRIPHHKFYVKGKRNLSDKEVKHLLNGTVTITEKVDGANTGVFRKKGKMYLQKRRAPVDDSHPQFKFFQRWYWDNYEKLDLLPDNTVTYGELLRCVHTIYYDKLPDWWLVYDIYDLDKDRYLDWNTIEDICSKCDISTVPLIFIGNVDKNILEKLMPGASLYGDIAEGMVVKNYKKQLRGKIVKPQFVKDPSFDSHWTKHKVRFNSLSASKSGYQINE